MIGGGHGRDPDALTLPGGFEADDLGDDTQELVDGPQFIQRIDGALEIECHILMDQDVAKSGKTRCRARETRGRRRSTEAV